MYVCTYVHTTNIHTHVFLFLFCTGTVVLDNSVVQIVPGASDFVIYHELKQIGIVGKYIYMFHKLQAGKI